jgi:hypothetical protein
MLQVVHCRYCKAEIDWNALKCRHCGEWVGEPEVAHSTAPTPAIDRPVTHFVPASTFATEMPSLLGWFATAALAGGVFLPFVSLPLIGGISFWNLHNDGVFVLATALIAMLAHWRQWRMIMLGATFPGTGLVAWDVMRLERELSDASGMVGLGLGAYILLASGVASIAAAWRMDR